MPTCKCKYVRYPMLYQTLIPPTSVMWYTHQTHHTTSKKRPIGPYNIQKATDDGLGSALRRELYYFRAFENVLDGG